MTYIWRSAIIHRTAWFHFTQAQERILASMVAIIERSCDSEEQALRVQAAHCSDITSFTRYLQVIGHYKQHCFDWTKPEVGVTSEQKLTSDHWDLHLFNRRFSWCSTGRLRSIYTSLSTCVRKGFQWSGKAFSVTRDNSFPGEHRSNANSLGASIIHVTPQMGSALAAGPEPNELEDNGPKYGFRWLYTSLYAKCNGPGWHLRYRLFDYVAQLFPICVSMNLSKRTQVINSAVSIYSWLLFSFYLLTRL